MYTNQISSFKSLNKLLVAAKQSALLNPRDVFKKPDDSSPSNSTQRDRSLFAPNARLNVLDSRDEVSSVGDLESLQSVNAFTLQ